MKTTIIKPKHIFISILALLFVFPLIGTFAQQAPDALSIAVIATFDYPGAGTSTIPTAINNRGDITGLIDAHGALRGFVRFASGRFSKPIAELTRVPVLPRGEASTTRARCAVTTWGATSSFTAFS